MKHLFTAFVMNQTSVALSDGHRRAPSPEYWLFPCWSAQLKQHS